MSQNPDQIKPYQGYPYINPPVTDVQPSPNIWTVNAHSSNNAENSTNKLYTKDDCIKTYANNNEYNTTIRYIDTSNRQEHNIDTDKFNNKAVNNINKQNANRYNTEYRIKNNINEEEERANYRNKDTDKPMTSANYETHTIYYNPYNDSANRRLDERQDNSEIRIDDNENYSERNFTTVTLDKQSETNRYKPNQLDVTIYNEDDGFNLTPLSVNDEVPPPSYNDVISQKNKERRVTNEEPQRTRVILTENNIHYNASNRRKMLICQQCGDRVQTVVSYEFGLVSYIIAILLFIIFMPLVLLMYFFTCLKYERHYCPQCNNLIGYYHPTRFTSFVFT